MNPADLDFSIIGPAFVAGLLVLNSLNSQGYAINDPDAIPDPIAHY